MSSLNQMKRNKVITPETKGVANKFPTLQL